MIENVTTSRDGLPAPTVPATAAVTTKKTNNSFFFTLTNTKQTFPPTVTQDTYSDPCCREMTETLLLAFYKGQGGGGGGGSGETKPIYLINARWHQRSTA